MMKKILECTKSSLKNTHDGNKQKDHAFPQLQRVLSKKHSFCFSFSHTVFTLGAVVPPQKNFTHLGVKTCTYPLLCITDFHSFLLKKHIHAHCCAYTGLLLCFKKSSFFY